ncbi:hypothetical protein EDB81DRAFT_772032 [Dactylonectria macrodidyma]|uniref:Uncharacterized protein n=1 Tax=Dactylonectria macrodidyma TaxID=307937 RepID=A0A9P9FT52_9HYPO|nr:hypothetical protein EDB81DRAFT_772032 [Dactylonectria macrodidyma]
MEYGSSRVDEREAQENRPLLGGDNTDVSQVMSRHHKYLFNGITASLGIGICILCFLYPIAALGAYGDRYEFQWGHSELNDTQAFILAASFIIIPLHIVNLILLKRRSKPLLALLNILHFGLSTLFSCFFSFFILIYVSINPLRYCDHPLYSGNPPWTPDQVEDCQKWAVKYKAVSTVFLVLLALYGIVQMVIFTLVLVDTFDTGRNTDRSELSAVRWSLPVGQFSVELSFRWGKLQAKAPQEQFEAAEGTRSQG